MKLSELMSKIQEILDFDGDMEVVAEGTKDSDFIAAIVAALTDAGEPKIEVCKLQDGTKMALINHEPEQ